MNDSIAFPGTHAAAAERLDAYLGRAKSPSADWSGTSPGRSTARWAGDRSRPPLATIEEASTVVVVVSAAHGAGDPTATEAIVWADAIDAADPTGPATKTTTVAYRLRDAALRNLGPAVSYNRRTEDEIDRKVIAHVREYGKITNQTVRNLLDVDIQRAGAILVDLVRREILRKAGSGQRGPGVEYQPGERFPSRRRPPRT